MTVLWARHILGIFLATLLILSTACHVKSIQVVANCHVMAVRVTGWLDDCCHFSQNVAPFGSIIATFALLDPKAAPSKEHRTLFLTSFLLAELWPRLSILTATPIKKIHLTLNLNKQKLNYYENKVKNQYNLNVY